MARLSLDLGAYADRLREIEGHAFSCGMMKSVLYVSQSPGPGRSVARRQENAAVTLETQCDTGTDFFIWIRCNPLKSPDSAKEIQGNASNGGTGSGPPLGIWPDCGKRSFRATRDA